MKKGLILIIVVVVLVQFMSVMVRAEQGFMIIVHASNAVTELTRDDIAKLFLKKIKQWETDKSSIQVVDLVQDHSVRNRFSESILNRKVPAVKAYWQKQIFSGRNVPPPEYKSEKEILVYVHENEGAIGYISRSTSIAGYNVKELQLRDE
ncbi:substrate-binding domain-containing protein [bacterium]|nr:substrate-binding domain-containing protein [bacterium]